MSKGSAYERSVCVRLSRWWSRGILEKPRSDIFWRTHGSGARATVRHKAGKRTRGQYGDIGATDPVGFPLINAVTFSLKRGYSSQGIGDLIDRPLDAKKKHPWEKWIDEAQAATIAAGSRWWMIISKRDRQSEIVVMPPDLWELLHFENKPDCRGLWAGSLISIGESPSGMFLSRVVACHFSHFLKTADPRPFVDV